MALVLIGSIAAVTDAVAASLVAGPTATRSAVDARVRVGAADAVADAVADSDTVKAAAVAAMQDAAVQAQLAWQKPALSETVQIADLNAGAYIRVGAVSATYGWPITTTGGIWSLDVIRLGDNRVQRATLDRGAGFAVESWWRARTGATYRPWVRRDWNKSEPYGSRDIDGLLRKADAGVYFVSKNQDTGTFPDGFTAGYLTVLSNSDDSAITTTHTLIDRISGREWRRSALSLTWQGWRETGVSVNHLALGGRDVRLQRFYTDYPRVSTGGKGAVVFRYDHGLTNFKNVLKPLHDQYNIPAYIAMNSRNWGVEENSGATITEAKSWANVEWGNHTADHEDKTGIASIYDAVVNGRIELEEQLGRVIHGFTVPGVIGFDKFDGFGVGGLDGYSNTYAGSLILAHHAVVSGMIGPSQRPLDGSIQIGAAHFTWEAESWATIKSRIDAAISGKTVLTLMAHPRVLGQSGYADAALAGQILAYVRAKIDSGELANISYYQSHNAVLDGVGASWNRGELPASETNQINIDTFVQDGAWTIANSRPGISGGLPVGGSGTHGGTLEVVTSTTMKSQTFIERRDGGIMWVRTSFSTDFTGQEWQLVGPQGTDITPAVNAYTSARDN